jgi:hypothetical protein
MSGATLAVVDGWPPGKLDHELAAFTDWHLKEQKLSADWQASWRTWVRNSKRWEPRNDQSRTLGRSSPGRGPHTAAILTAFDRVDFG